jgi:serine/threonine protein phosphatase 1
MSSLKIQYLSKNHKGRDFVCGDLHGCFELLEERLCEIHFNYQHDRLFSVGDIIDRGGESDQALNYLKKSWFYCIRGNHEQMFLDWCTEDTPIYRNDAFRFHIHNGGLWIAQYLGVHIQTLADDVGLEGNITEQYPQLLPWIEAIKKLPYAIEIKSETKTIGIVHAEVPENISWPSLESELTKTNVLYSLLFSRKYIY